MVQDNECYDHWYPEVGNTSEENGAGQILDEDVNTRVRR